MVAATSLPTITRLRDTSPEALPCEAKVCPWQDTPCTVLSKEGHMTLVHWQPTPACNLGVSATSSV